MALNRDLVVKELKENVIEFFFALNSSIPPVKLSLKPDYFKVKAEQIAESAQKFHNDNKEEIIGWNVVGGGWVQLNINDIVYTQIVDGY